LSSLLLFPKAVVGSYCIAMPIANPIERFIGKIEKPSLLGQHQPANRAANALKKDHVSVSHLVVGRTANPAESRLGRLTTIEHR